MSSSISTNLYSRPEAPTPVHISTPSVQEKLNYFIQTKKIPNIIFHGTSGTGKRTIVQEFLKQIYHENVQNIKRNVMFVNCSEGKGIKFIRNELKFFAKTNIHYSTDVPFKTIVLFNAESLTTDAQSALRRCIELFSHNTRFFIVVENKHKLLNPILSRFCEIYVPDILDKDGNSVNLHKRKINQIFQGNEHSSNRNEQLKAMLDITTPDNNYETTLQLSNTLYHMGYSAMDIVNLFPDNNTLQFKYYKLKNVFRSEPMLMFFILLSYRK